jgi:cytochrome c553
MKKPVEKLTDDDILSIAAYLASLAAQRASK